MARNEVVRSLCNRLEIVATLKAHPEIERKRVDAPILVTGTGRSGTSILHELLAQDPAHRTLLTWRRCIRVRPERASYRTDRASRSRTVSIATFWNLVTPEYATMHEKRGRVAARRLGDRDADVSLGSLHGLPGRSVVRDASRARRHVVLLSRFIAACSSSCSGDGPSGRWLLKWPASSHV
jgi:hypothetical protein